MNRDLSNKQFDDLLDYLEEKLKSKEKPKSKLLFILTMPNVGSWNGKWTGEGRVYARARRKAELKYFGDFAPMREGERI